MRDNEFEGYPVDSLSQRMVALTASIDYVLALFEELEHSGYHSMLMK